MCRSIVIGTRPASSGWMAAMDCEKNLEGQMVHDWSETLTK
jgi:thioredoxin reductase (NADPH)